MMEAGAAKQQASQMRPTLMQVPESGPEPTSFLRLISCFRFALMVPLALPQQIAEPQNGQVVIGFTDPLGAFEEAQKLASTGVIALSMEMIPRITRAQSMDALSGWLLWQDIRQYS